MFLVGGGILVHAWPALHHMLEHFGGGFVVENLINFTTGLLAGGVVLVVVNMLARLRR
jgi:predicted DNA repair protein MutK